MTYDLLLKPPHIRPAIELVQKFPEQFFVVDHIAKPDIARGMRSRWAEDINDLAKFDNVYCKLSGMVTETNWGTWQPTDFCPTSTLCSTMFGAKRLMIGSDWPVCTLSGTYEDVMGIVVDYVNSLSRGDREEILGGTCARFYSLTEIEMLVPNSGGV